MGSSIKKKCHADQLNICLLLLGPALGVNFFTAIYTNIASIQGVRRILVTKRFCVPSDQASDYQWTKK